MGVVKDQAIWEAESEGQELLNSTMGDVLDQQAAAFPDKEAIVMERVKAEMGADSHTDPFELKSATVGIPASYTDVKLIHPQSGEVVGFGETGELLTRGFAVMQGYYNMPDKTAEAIDEESWLHTGDLATMTPQGDINIVGRAKDMIIRGGENLYPAEIEALLLRHPKVADAQVVGVPDAFMGEEAAALLRSLLYQPI
jgi:acyl-CoA synthetase (AMP-forming)/AMP-acid ligase II